MYYSRFSIDESVALAGVAIAWIASLACEWLLVLSGIGGGLIQRKAKVFYNFKNQVFYFLCQM